ncbi:MAG: hypothetical protein COV29_04250 [Candidatus Yanofskybacteria bacterium CG10_big_fil_rev_8_21_14_0_10_36_16]|uniref:Nudix hydrolase domain-containing protein n=1 Tax=Candidatus Yanofskybacteria bacterium CG10_big_fil_rev_8_21_14_0_10_36_16 TaxID=1975096 RepID=A0A2J0Q9Z9_9BACT|nr:MAG: hypothetical protein COV29_04250 [Candidatus Yanofskybacteria bacterium CG10_big_fil_rev_8_21_14_0_10_36_16]
MRRKKSKRNVAGNRPWETPPEDMKHFAITADMFPPGQEYLAHDLAREHRMFEESGCLKDLEEHSDQTVVAIGLFDEKFILVDDQNKSGLGFPGGSVTPGEMPVKTLIREIGEEVDLSAEVFESYYVEFPVGETQEDPHIFSAYWVSFIGNKPNIKKFDKEEPITAIYLVSYDTILRLCQTNGILIHEGKRTKPILRNHRIAFLQMVELLNSRSENSEKEASYV